MPRAPTILPTFGAVISTGVFAILTIHTPGQVEAVSFHALCAGTGAFVAGAAGAIISNRKECHDLFGKKKENGINWEDRVKPNNGSGENIKEECTLEQPKTVLPGKMAAEAAAALSGIKALIESIQVTDQETWNAVTKYARSAQEALAEMETDMANAIEASKKARAALDELVVVVGDR